MTEDVDFWITQAQAAIESLHERLSREDEVHLEQIKQWCEASPALWKVIVRIGWEVNEG
ncbi:MAG TPA: hypothetical protein VFA10_17845 [Ktedonobacteraceae bacterium]|nr:hypothetical protein [Ktedonobacteraceae bacterium]